MPPVTKVEERSRVITVRLPADVYRKVFEEAHDARKSMNVHCVDLLRQGPRSQVERAATELHRACLLARRALRILPATSESRDALEALEAALLDAK